MSLKMIGAGFGRTMHVVHLHVVLTLAAAALGGLVYGALRLLRGA